MASVVTIRQGSPRAGRIVGWIFAAVGLLLLGVAAHVWSQEHAFLTRAERTRGLVVGLREHWSSSRSNGSNGPTYSPTFTFADRKGQEHRVEAHTGANPPAYQIGESVDVFYTPENPEQAQLRGFFTQWGAAFVCGILGGAFALFGTAFLFLAGRDGRLTAVQPA